MLKNKPWIFFWIGVAILFMTLPSVAAGRWSEPDVLISGGAPSLIQDRDGIVWLAYDTMVENNEDIYVIFSRDLSSWSQPIRITDDLETDFHPSIVQSKDGRFFVVFTSLRSGNYDLYISESHDGRTWSKPKRLTEDEHNDWYPFIMEDKKGTLIISFSSNREGDNGIFVMSSSDGEDWSKERRVTGPNNDIYPMIVEDRNWYWMVFVRHTGDYSDFRRANEHDLFLIYSSDLVEWSKIGRLTFSKPGTFSLYPAFLMDENGTLWISYTSDEPGNEEIFIFGSNDGELWSSPEKITSNMEYLESINSTWRFKCDMKGMIQERGGKFLLAYECAKIGDDIYLASGVPSLDFSGAVRVEFNISEEAGALFLKGGETAGIAEEIGGETPKPGYDKIILGATVLIVITSLYRKWAR